jgi:cytochrome c oxidase subunit 2
MRRTRANATLALVLACGGCSLHNAQNALDVSGPQAGRIAGLWWLMLPIGAVVWTLVVSVMLVGIWSKRPGQPSETIARDDVRERGLARVVIGAVTATVVILFIVLVSDFRVGHALTMPPKTTVVPIRITGHQYWWEIQYPDSVAQNIVITANELHVPVGKVVVLELASRDVIHSFWVPSLVGKKDLLPGYTRSLWFRADTAGVYRGQCAEFCGLQHAKMGLLVIAEPQQQFDAWTKAQRTPGAEPSDALAARGKAVFLGTSCTMCHSVGGTTAGAQLGPDLTHIASRRTIASGTLPNTAESLLSWIADPQKIKPGTIMPAAKLDARDMSALVAYLRQLK